MIKVSNFANIFWRNKHVLRYLVIGFWLCSLNCKLSGSFTSYTQASTSYITKNLDKHETCYCFLLVPFTEVDAAHYLGQVLRRQLWQEQSLFYSGKSSLSFTQVNPANPQYKPPWQYIYKWRFVFFVFSAVKHRGNNVNPASVKQALMASARRLPGFNIFEQGTCEKIKVCKGRNWNYRVIWYYQLSW